MSDNNDKSKFICLIEFTAQLLEEIVRIATPMTLSDPAPTNLDELLTADKKRWCSTPEGLKCRTEDEFEILMKPLDIVLKFEDSKWTLSTKWGHMLVWGLLEPDTSMKLWAYKDASDDGEIAVFAFIEVPKPNNNCKDESGPMHKKS